MARIFLRLGLFLLVVSGAGIGAARADYFKYTDAKGSVNMTNKLDAVPKKYRAHVKVIKEDPPAKKPSAMAEGQGGQGGQGTEESVSPQEAAGPVQAATPAPAPAPQGKFAALSARYVWFKPLIGVAGIIVVFLLVVRVASALSSPQLAKVLYLSFFIGVFVFLYKVYVERLYNDTVAVKEKAIKMMQKSNVREIALPAEEMQGEGK